MTSSGATEPEAFEGAGDSHDVSEQVVGETEIEESVLPVDDEQSEVDDEHDEQADGAETDSGVTSERTRAHLKGLLEALAFASDKPLTPLELAKKSSAKAAEVKDLLCELRRDYEGRGVRFEQVAGGWCFRTNIAFAPFVRELGALKPVKLTRAQLEALAIVAYRQPVTRPDIDDIRGVDSGPVLKMLLERDLVRILGKKEEPGRPLIYGTGPTFLELFGLSSLKDLPTLREFAELSEDSKRVVERELGESAFEASTALSESESEPFESNGIAEA